MRRLSAVLPGFAKARSGIAALEFALIAPVLILFYFGAVELDAAMSAQRKATAAAGAVADLVAQDDNLDNAERDAILIAARAIVAPMDPQNRMAVCISSLKRNNGGNLVVSWREQMNSGACADHAAPPAGLLENGGTNTIIAVSVRLPHESALGQILRDGITLSDTYYLRPRRGLCVRRNGAAC